MGKTLDSMDSGELKTVSNANLMNYMKKMNKGLEDKMSSLEGRFDGFVKEVKVLKKEVDCIAKIQKATTKEVGCLKRELTILQQKALANDVILSGVPEQKGENLFDVISSIVKKFGLNIKSTDVRNLYRFKTTTGFSPILIEFYRKEVRDFIFREQKAKGPVSLSEIELSASASSSTAVDKRRIYFKDRLTKENLKLFKLAKEFKDKNRYKFLWMSKSEYLLIQKDKDDIPHQICCVEDLQNLEIVEVDES